MRLQEQLHCYKIAVLSGGRDIVLPVAIQVREPLMAACGTSTCDTLRESGKVRN